MLSVVFEALEVILTVPEALVADVGANLALMVVLWPADSVIDEVELVKLNPVPLTVIWEIVTLALPEFVTVADSDLFCPTLTLPNPKLAGLAVSWPVAVVPTPETGTVSVAFEASEEIVRLPLDVPAEVGANCTPNAALWPAATVCPFVSPLRVNPAPLMLTLEIVTLEPPVLAIVPDIV